MLLAAGMRTGLFNDGEAALALLAFFPAFGVVATVVAMGAAAPVGLSVRQVARPVQGVTQEYRCLETVQPLRQQRVELDEPACVEMTKRHVMSAYVSHIHWSTRSRVRSLSIRLRQL